MKRNRKRYGLHVVRSRTHKQVHVLGAVVKLWSCVVLVPRTMDPVANEIEREERRDEEECRVGQDRAQRKVFVDPRIERKFAHSEEGFFEHREHHSDHATEAVEHVKVDANRSFEQRKRQLEEVEGKMFAPVADTATDTSSRLVYASSEGRTM